MANEITLQISMRIAKDNLNYQSQPTSFRASMSIGKGQTPGGITATLAGTDVDLSKLVQPGLTRFANLDKVNFVTVGIYDTVTNRFYPVAKILPGEFYILRLADDIGEEYIGTGTGTGHAPTKLRVKAAVAPCLVLVEAFET